MNCNRETNITVPPQAQKILCILRNAGHEAYVVGGCVRDCLLGREPEDWDITTSALPSEVKSLFFHTVDTGIQHGTVMVLMGGTGYEVTTYRKDGVYSDGRRPDTVEFTPSLEEDLKRRDFTINALAYNEETGIVDLFDGIRDLENGIVRCVGDPDLRFSEDALRIMRAVRFAAQLSFAIDPKTWQAIRNHADHLAKVSMERIRVEFEKTLLSAHPEYVNKYAELGLSAYILRTPGNKPAPKKTELLLPAGQKAAEGLCFREDSVPLYRAFVPALSDERCSLEEQKQKLRYLRLAAFFKELPPEDAAGQLRQMTYDNRTKAMVRNILANKDRTIPADRRYIKQALKELGEETLELVWLYKTAALQAAQITVGEQRCFEMRDGQMLADCRELTDEILQSGEAYKISMLDVDGNAIIEQGVQPGEEVGRILDRLVDIVIREPEKNSRLLLLEEVHAILSEKQENNNTGG